MADDQVVLQFELQTGRYTDAVVTAEALIAWVDALREASQVLDPLGDVAVGLVRAEEGSLRLIALLRLIENKILGKPADFLNQYPRIKKLILLNILVLPGAYAGATLVQMLNPDETVKIAPESVALLQQPEAQDARIKVEQSPVVQSKVRKFYRTVEREPAITAVKVAERPSGPALYEVPRSQFPERGGLWLPQEMEPPTQARGAIWDVIVTHPVAIGEPRVWGFMRDGLPFRAKVVDETFLAAIRARTLPLAVQEGVMMRVEVTWQEQLEGQTWMPIPRSYRVTRVFAPSF